MKKKKTLYNFQKKYHYDFYNIAVKPENLPKIRNFVNTKSITIKPHFHHDIIHKVFYNNKMKIQISAAENFNIVFGF